MNEWTDAQLDEDIQRLRGDPDHDYWDLLKDIVVPREVARRGWYSNLHRQMRIEESSYVDNLVSKIAGESRHYYITGQNNRTHAAQVGVLLDYEEALTSRYLSHYTRDGQPTGVLMEAVREHQQLLLEDEEADEFTARSRFDEHIRRAAMYNEEDWENVLGFHPVDLAGRRVSFMEKVGVEEGRPRPSNLDALENNLLRGWTERKTTDIVQHRLNTEHFAMVRGALNFAEIMYRSPKSTTFFKWRNDQLQPRTYVTEIHDRAGLEVAVETISNKREESRLKLGKRLPTAAYNEYNFLNSINRELRITHPLMDEWLGTNFWS